MNYTLNGESIITKGYYADSLVTIKNGHFDVQTVMTAFDQTIRKSKDHRSIYIEGFFLDEHGEIAAEAGS